MTTNSLIFRGEMMHVRHLPIRHAFHYKVFQLLIDLDELPLLNRNLGLFGYNRRALVTIFDRDHFDKGSGKSIKQAVIDQLQGYPVDLTGGKIYMLTNPRILGYTFNPLSVFYCFNATGEWVATIAEVHNTLGDRLSYILTSENQIPTTNPSNLGTQSETEDRARTHHATKQLWVSPFIPMDMRYELTTSPIGGKMFIHIDEFRDEQRFFQARQWGNTTPLTTRSLLACLFRYPMMTFQVVGLIHWEGIKLIIKGSKKGIRFTRKNLAYQQAAQLAAEKLASSVAPITQSPMSGQPDLNS